MITRMQDGKLVESEDSDNHRRFCMVHLRRGDCDFEDADSNYVVVDGPGPNEAEGWEGFESPSAFGGVI